ncbi:MAG TPA: hypothetical protein V6D02_14635 [Candidatus Obscuribacterales bacterium]
MIQFSRAFKLIQWPAIPFVALGLMAAGTVPLIATSAQAQDRDVNYGACTAALIAEGIAAETAVTACALAFEPTQVSSCVSGVMAVSSVDPTAALSACSRDRRPDEVAACVSDIHGNLVVDDPLAVLTSCHRSILPERYAACVVGIAAEANYGTEDSLAACIAAGYRPENVAPTYIPMD